MGRIRTPDGPAGPATDILKALHLLHIRAGEPSMRELARLTAMSHDTVHRVLVGPGLPRWGPLELVVEALGGDTREFRTMWLTARLADDVRPGDDGPVA